jgi:spoIIIJ-associated protein
MSRRTEGRGPNLTDALRDALADLLDTDAQSIVLRVDAPGVDEVTGHVALALEVVPATTTASDEGSFSTTAPSGRDSSADSPSSPEDEPAADGSSADESSADEPTTDEPSGSEGRGDDDRTEGEADQGVTLEELEQEADAAADFLEGLLDALDLPGDIRIRTTEDHAEVEVVEIGSGALIGRRGQTLEAIQELVRCALQREFQRRSRVKVDAEGYRSRRLEKLIEKAEDAIDEVLDTGEPVRLEPMDVFERKSVHQRVAAVEGVISRSQGREPARRVVIERD